MCFLCEPSGLARIQSFADACGAVMETSNKRTENKGLVQTIRISLTLVGARCGQSWFVLVHARSTKAAVSGLAALPRNSLPRSHFRFAVRRFEGAFCAQRYCSAAKMYSSERLQLRCSVRSANFYFCAKAFQHLVLSRSTRCYRICCCSLFVKF